MTATRYPTGNSIGVDHPVLGRWLSKFVVALFCLQLASCATHGGEGRFFVDGTDGVSIAYEATGSGEVGLIFVHGWSCDRSYWREQITAFGDDYRVVTVDLGGHGESANNRADWSISSFGQDVAAVAATLDVEDIILIGHSMGGPVVVDAASRIRNRVIGVVGVDTFKDVSREPASREEAKGAFAVNKADFSTRTESFVRRAFFVKDSPASLIDEIAEDMAAGDPVVAAESGASLSTYDVRGGFDGISDIPVVLINADYRPTNTTALKAIHTNSELLEISNAGHFVMLEKPIEFNAAIRATAKKMVQSK